MGVQVGSIVDIYRDNGKENGDYRDYRDCVGLIGSEDSGSLSLQPVQSPKMGSWRSMLCASSGWLTP